MGIARFVLKMLPGVERPPIASMVPTMRGRCCVLDLGANVDCSPVHLSAVRGDGLDALFDRRQGRAALGRVAQHRRGGDQRQRHGKQAGDLLKASGLNYFGNVEGYDIYRGTTDVVVCDGFVGNVFLKSSEQLARMLASYLSEEFRRTPLNRLRGAIAWPVLKAFKRRVDPRLYNGASLLGLRGIVVKSHGAAGLLPAHLRRTQLRTQKEGHRPLRHRPRAAQAGVERRATSLALTASAPAG